jgi:hypothetical protein
MTIGKRLITTDENYRVKQMSWACKDKERPMGVKLMISD